MTRYNYLDDNILTMCVIVLVILIVGGAAWIFIDSSKPTLEKPTITLSQANTGTLLEFHTYATLDTFIKKGSVYHTVGKTHYYTYYYIYVGSDKTGSSILKFDKEQKLGDRVHVIGYLTNDMIQVRQIVK